MLGYGFFAQIDSTKERFHFICPICLAIKSHTGISISFVMIKCLAGHHLYQTFHDVTMITTLLWTLNYAETDFLWFNWIIFRCGSKWWTSIWGGVEGRQEETSFAWGGQLFSYSYPIYTKFFIINFHFFMQSIYLMR